ncbi:MAG TPA: beta-galactosidase, partial [Anaerolineales bacterium]|nr:beta-galactosidase [Anaerolineales bacterium]
GDLEGVNKAWWATFWSHRYSDWDEIEPVDPSNNGLMLDWQRYNSDQVVFGWRSSGCTSHHAHLPDLARLHRGRLNAGCSERIGLDADKRG